MSRTDRLGEARAFIIRNWPLLIGHTAGLPKFLKDHPDDYLAVTTSTYNKSAWLLPLLSDWGEDGTNQVSCPSQVWAPPHFVIPHVIAIAALLAINGYLGIGAGFVDQRGSGIVLMFLNSRDADGEDIMSRPVFMPPGQLPELPKVEL